MNDRQSLPISDERLREALTWQPEDRAMAADLASIVATATRAPQRRWTLARLTGTGRVGNPAIRVLFALMLLGALAVAIAVFVGSQRRLPPPFGLARPGLIAYMSSGHLSVMNPDGSGRRQFTFGPNSDTCPTWSQDGTAIAYLSSASGNSNSLVVISADGLRQVTIADRLARSDSCGISWSPDGRRLVFAAANADSPLSLSHIFVAEADRPGAVEIGGPQLAGFEPAWSPDGKHIVFHNLVPVDALWLIEADGSNAHRLTNVRGSGYAFWAPNWSSDGSHLVFLAGDDGAHDVWTIKVDGSDEGNITNSAENEWFPSWSPDGARIAFVRSTPEGHGSVVVVNADGSQPDVLAGPFMNSNYLIWSPDGTKLFGPSEDVSRPTMIVYDVLGSTPPVVLPDADVGDWQRLAD